MPGQGATTAQLLGRNAGRKKGRDWVPQVVESPLCSIWGHPCFLTSGCSPSTPFPVVLPMLTFENSGTYLHARTRPHTPAHTHRHAHPATRGQAHRPAGSCAHARARARAHTRAHTHTQTHTHRNRDTQAYVPTGRPIWAGTHTRTPRISVQGGSVDPTDALPCFLSFLLAPLCLASHSSFGS